jgi:hypothetical protein
MDATLPGVPVGLDLLGLAGERLLVFALRLDRDAGLEVGVVVDAVGRVQVDELHGAAHPLALEQAGHDGETVTEDKSVRPADGVLVELDLCGSLKLRVGKQVELQLLSMQRRHGRGGGEPLVHVQADRIGGKGGPLGLAGPLQLRIEVRIVRPGSTRGGLGLVPGQASFRVVQPGRLVVPIILHARRRPRLPTSSGHAPSP